MSTPETKETKKANHSTPSLTSKITDLNTRIQWFYSDDFNLDEAMSRYESAAKLAEEIESSLKTLKNKLTVLDSKV